MPFNPSPCCHSMIGSIHRQNVQLLPRLQRMWIIQQNIIIAPQYRFRFQSKFFRDPKYRIAFHNCIFFNILPRAGGDGGMHLCQTRDPIKRYLACGLGHLQSLPTGAVGPVSSALADLPSLWIPGHKRSARARSHTAKQNNGKQCRSCSQHGFAQTDADQCIHKHGKKCRVSCPFLMGVLLSM